MEVHVCVFKSPYEGSPAREKENIHFRGKNFTIFKLSTVSFRHRRS